MRLGKRNGAQKRGQSKFPGMARAAASKPAHLAVAKLAVALREYKQLAEQHGATAEILRVIARSPTDVQPVFDAIASSAQRLFGAYSAAVTRLIDGTLHLQAWTATGASGEAALKKLFPARVADGPGLTARAAHAGRPLFVSDTEIEYSGAMRKMARARGFRSALAVPMLRKREVIGTISVARREPGTFSKRQIGLLQTFADQAVIAIENARLFNETREALEHQKAAADILRIVASSVESTDAVFDAITAAGKRLLPDMRVALLLVRNGELHYASHSGITPERRAVVSKYFPLPLDRKSVVGTATVDKRVMAVPDIQAERKRYPRSLMTSRISGARAMLAVPLIRDGIAVGTLAVTRTTAGPFSEKQVAVAQTFADQALIALRNASQFREIQDRNAELKQSLDFQGATSEILAAISSSIADTQPVFDAINRNLLRLVGARNAAVMLVRDGQIHVPAVMGQRGFERMLERYPIPLDQRTFAGKAILSGKVVHVAPVIGNPLAPETAEANARAFSYNSIISAPMMRDGKAVGAITASRTEARAFGAKEIALIKAFADQAVIAIENARLFNETKEALERQAASSDVLGVISKSPGDVAPVFEAILKNATRLCGAHLGFLLLAEGDKFRTVAHCGGAPELLKWTFGRGAYEVPPITTLGQAIAERRPLQAADIKETPAFRAGVEVAVKFVNLGGARTYLAVPLVRDDKVVGVISIYRPEVRPFTDAQVELVRSFAGQAVIAMENARLFNETREALERQTATSEILRVISQSPTDTQPVFDAVAERAGELCDASNASVLIAEGDVLKVVARVGEAVPFSELPIRRTLLHGRAFLERRTVHVEDIVPLLDSEYPDARENQRATGFRTFLSVPMMREGQPIGTIGIWRREFKPFSTAQIELMETFAAQAVIAIENVRLFNETNEALERQTATAEILKVISGSPTDIGPVLRAVATNAKRLCEASDAVVQLREGNLLRFMAHEGAIPVQAIGETLPISRGLVTGRAVLEGRQVHIHDHHAEEAAFPEGTALARKFGFRTMLVTPLMRAGGAIGTIVIRRTEVKPFSEKHLALMKTFAAQAVIAIENVRLFNETKESLEQQTASAEILKVISSSPTATQPVFDAIVESGARLFAPSNATIVMREGDRLVRKARAGPALPEVDQAKIAALYPLPFDPQRSMVARCIVERRIIEVPDTEAEGLPSSLRTIGQAAGYRAITLVPFIRAGEGIGVIGLSHPQPGFKLTEKQLALVRTFADQAVIAIENVRLFNETKEALDHQKASSEVLEVISSSVADTQPVYDKILESCNRLFEGHDIGIALLREDGRLHVGAWHGRGGQFLREKVFPMPLDRESGAGMAMLERKVMHFPDIDQGEDVPSRMRFSTQETGVKSSVIAPMLWEGKAIGALYVGRARVQPFSPKEIVLVKTFADQAVIAIQNARLFNETKEALERQTATSEILGVISSTPTDTEPVFAAIVENARRLTSARNAVVLLRRDSDFTVAGYSAQEPAPTLEELPAEVRTAPLDREKNFPSRAILDGELVHVPDWEADDVIEFERAVAKAYGIGSGVILPLLREGRGIGALAVTRATKGPFHEKEIALLRSFADQAVIAIENVRLFNETNEALEQQTATADILKVISSSPTATQPVFEAIVQSAARLVEPCRVVLVMREGDLLQRKARAGPRDEMDGAALATIWPLPFDPERSMAARSIIERRIIEIPDTEAPGLPPVASRLAKAAGYRSITNVPLLREGEGIGLIALLHPQPGFKLTDKQLALLRTFADQAVIAIENVRLFNETKESLEQQTAISEVLRVISASPTDVKPVLDAVAMRAARICEASDARLFLLEDGQLRNTAAFGEMWTSIRIGDAFTLDGSTVTAAAVLDRQVVHVEDTNALPDGMYPGTRETALRGGYRTILSVPLMREQRSLGAITLRRTEARPFTEKQIALVKTFADQAAIAIENVRLFNETQEALQQQTATAEVLSVISGSITDARPVFEAISRAVLRLYGARHVGLYVRAGERIDRVGYAVADRAADDGSQALWPIPLDDKSFTGRTILSGELVHIKDLQAEAGLSDTSRELHRITEVRSVLLAPMQSMGVTLGALSVARRSPGGFSDRELELIRTFADQAVIAMENVRLFREIEEKSRQLETASKHKSQFLASMSHELRTPLNAILGFNEMILDGIYGDLTADVRAPLENVQSSGKHLLRLINNVLDLAKIEAGRMELALSDFSVHDTVASVHSTLKPLAAEKGVQFVAEVPPDIPLARGDAGRIAQCLMNLAGNSLKFTKEGRVAIAVAQDNGLLRFSVVDTGIGIPAEKIPTLFTEFKQTDATIASEYGGTGLGLSITKKFIEMHGGRIWVESEPGKGSNFQFEIPLRAVP